MDELVKTLLALVEQQILFAVVMIGNSGSGKTTLAKEIAKYLRIEIISPDMIRADLGSELDQSLNSMVWQVVGQLLFEKSQGRECIIFDATNAKLQDRRNLLADLQEKGFATVGIWVDTPLEICLQHNKVRHLPRPKYAIERMGQSLNEYPPLRWEGFDYLFQVVDQQVIVVN